jgi:hypothetical protein
MNCSPTVSLNFTKEEQYFSLIKVHTRAIIIHIRTLLIDFHFIKSKLSTSLLHNENLNFMFETR